MGQVLWVYLYLSQNIFYDATIILQFEEPLFILITFIKPHCIFGHKKLHFDVFMGELLSPSPQALVSAQCEIPKISVLGVEDIRNEDMIKLQTSVGLKCDKISYESESEIETHPDNVCKASSMIFLIFL